MYLELGEKVGWKAEQNEFVLKSEFGYYQHGSSFRFCLSVTGN
jgi:hypothetical protein